MALHREQKKKNSNKQTEKGKVKRVQQAGWREEKRADASWCERGREWERGAREEEELTRGRYVAEVRE